MLDIQNQILSKKQVLQKVKRIAFEIYEQNADEESIVIAGIQDMGYTFASMLVDTLKEISPIQPQLVEVTLDKLTPLQGDVKLEVEEEALKQKVVILVDDVLNTGRTLAYSLKPFLNLTIKKLQVAVLVDRNHKNFPISADFVGYSLSTTINEHIHVELVDEQGFGVYLD